jgi:hypothetical protein
MHEAQTWLGLNAHAIGLPELGSTQQHCGLLDSTGCSGMTDAPYMRSRSPYPVISR